MAFYDYICKDCDRIFEVQKGMNEKLEPKCPFCKSSKTCRKFTVLRRMTSKADDLNNEGSEQSGSCSTCTSGVCSSCNN